MSIWFGRSRVQERVGDTDERNVTERPSARMDEPPATGGMPTRRGDDRATDVDKGPAIDALRAATNAAGSTRRSPTRRLPTCGVPVRRARTAGAVTRCRVRDRPAARPDVGCRAPREATSRHARRTTQAAECAVAEAMSLQMHGFASYEAFAAIYEPERLAASLADDSEMGSEETIARIRVLLTELGVDPLDDPLQAASEFLTAHEGEIPAATSPAPTQPAPTQPVPAVVAQPLVAEPPAPEPRVTERVVAQTPVAEPVAEPVVAETPVAEPPPAEPLVAETPVEAPMADHVVEHLDIAEVVANIGPAPTPAPELPAPELPALPTIAAAAAMAAAAAKSEPEIAPAEAGIDEVDEIRLEPDLPPTPVAGIPGTVELPAAAEVPGPADPSETWAEPPLAKPAEDEVVERWIHAEARAERMHAEVDRAQAELMAMLGARPTSRSP